MIGNIGSDIHVYIPPHDELLALAEEELLIDGLLALKEVASLTEALPAFKDEASLPEVQVPSDVLIPPLDVDTAST